MHVGIPYAPISPAYSLMSSDFGKLRTIIDLLTPGMVFASDGDAFGARHRGRGAGRSRTGGDAQSAGDRQATLFADLVGAEDASGVAARARPR